MIQRFIMEVDILQFIWFALIAAFLSWRISWSIKDFVEWKREQREMIERDKIREKAKKLREDYLKSFSLSGPFKPDSHIIAVDWTDRNSRLFTYMVSGERSGKAERWRINSRQHLKQ